MASISTDKAGRRRILFVSGSTRRAIRLGKIPMRTAESLRVKIEAILAGNLTGALDAETARWVAQIDDGLHAKLARVGLVTPRERVQATLGQLMDEFFANLDVKAGTVTTYQQTRARLEDHFCRECLLSDISALDADRWRASMQDDGLAPATISKRVKTARQMFRRGVRWGMAELNPFDGVKAGAQTNRSRMRFVTLVESERVLEACPDAEWRLIFALSRFGGLRCPSEHLALTWRDVDWEKGRLTVRSRKTESLERGGLRAVPIFPELRPYLMEAFELADEGAEFVIRRTRCTSANLRTQLNRIIRRAGLEPWPRLFHNLRASRQTELMERFPIHVVCEWLGNTKAVAADHYLQVHDDHFARAVSEPADSKAAQNPAQHASEPRRMARKEQTPALSQVHKKQGRAAECDSLQVLGMTPGGFEPPFPG